jgi:hypothetical protein
MRTVYLAFVAMCLVQSIGAAFAGSRDCDDPLLSVQAKSDDLVEMVCNAASAAKALLVSCGLEQTHPIDIEVVDAAQHPTFGDCMAVFDQRTGCLQLTDIDRLPLLLPAGDARSDLPPEVLFSATITHEMAHALLQQSAGDVQIAATEQEFVANAFEMQSFDPKWRDLLLQSHPIKPPGSLGLVHLSIYALDPRAFANNAWVVFDQDVMGCSLIKKISEGKFRFPRH